MAVLLSLHRAYVYHRYILQNDCPIFRAWKIDTKKTTKIVNAFICFECRIRCRTIISAHIGSSIVCWHFLFNPWLTGRSNVYMHCLMKTNIGAIVLQTNLLFRLHSHLYCHIKLLFFASDIVCLSYVYVWYNAKTISAEKNSTTCKRNERTYTHILHTWSPDV